MYYSDMSHCQAVGAAGSGGTPAIYFADMGYASYNNFTHVIKNGQYFLIRANDSRNAGILCRPDMVTIQKETAAP